MVEVHANKILKGSDKEDVAFLVVGDPFAATTHTDLMVRASEMNIEVKAIHNASIMNAIAACGLQLYNFGQTVSICYFTEKVKHESFYDKIKKNFDIGFHTLCLLDIQVKEQSFENLMKGNRIYEPPRFMSVKEAIDQLLYIDRLRDAHFLTEDTLAIGVARIGGDTQMIVSGRMGDLRRVDFGGPLHSMVVPGEVHFIEQEVVDFYNWKKQGLELLPEDDQLPVEKEAEDEVAEE